MDPTAVDKSKEVLDFFIQELRKQSFENPGSLFMGSLLFNLQDAFEKAKGLSLVDWHLRYRNENKNLNKIFKKAFETVYGKDAWKEMKEANRPI